MKIIKNFKLFESIDISDKYGQAIRQAIKNDDFNAFEEIVDENVTDDSKKIDGQRFDKELCLRWAYYKYNKTGAKYIDYLENKFNYTPEQLEGAKKFKYSSEE